jgi:thiol:disulfide interchange protein
MKTRILSMLGSAALLLSGFCSPAFAAEAPAKTKRPAIYDENADGAKQIADALALAKKENKRVLLQFGANWCGWCHKLHKLCQTDAEITAKLKESFVVVLVDVNKDHNSAINKRYGNPTRFGLPVIVILDADGKALTTQDTGKLEQGDHHDPKKVLAFLNEWAGKKS